MRQRIYFVYALLSLAILPLTVSAQVQHRNLTQENRQLREENDSLRRLLAEYEEAYASTWDALVNMDWEKDYDDVFGASDVLNSSDREHTDFMHIVQAAAPQVASSWHRSIDEQVAVYLGKRKRYLPAIIGRYEYYFPIFKTIFGKYDIPDELISLCIVESAVTTTAVSRAGAAGMWQLMPATARRYGLRVDELVDERFDVYKSTEVAAHFLRDVHKGLGRWDLTVLSYNCGAGRVRQAIIQSGGSGLIWDTAACLPAETRRYLPSFLAVRYVISEADAFGIQPLRRTYPKVKVILVDTPISKEEFCKNNKCSLSLFRECNPHVLTERIPEGVSVYVPF